MFFQNQIRKIALSISKGSHKRITTVKIILMSISMLFLVNAGNSINSIKNVAEELHISKEFSSPDDLIKSIIDSAKLYLGRPYQFRNPLGNIMDCSGFVQYVFSLHDIQLSRTASTIYAECEKIDLSEVQPGDLLIFKGTDPSSNRIGHISMVTEVNGENLKMIHSSSRGVVIDDFPAMKNYKKRFLFACRVPQLRERFNVPQRGDAAIVQLPVTKELSLSVIGVGDIMLGTDFPNAQTLPPNDGKDLLTPVSSFLQSAELCVGNLEGTFLSGAGTPKQTADPANCYAFKSPDSYVYHLRDAGIDVVSIANNHIADFGADGKANTVKMLGEAGIKYAGLLEYPSVVFEKDSLRFGFCAFAPNTSTMKLTDYAVIRSTVRKLAAECDIVIVSFHGGAEGSSYRHVTRKTEKYLGEDRGNPYEFARAAIDAGADIVFGHGPHVTRAIDIYKNRFIAYSLGNFATYGMFKLTGSNGVAPIIKVNINSFGEFISANITSIKQEGEGGPVPDETNAALKEIIELTKADFPKSDLIISESGEVTSKVRELAAQNKSEHRKVR